MDQSNEVRLFVIILDKIGSKYSLDADSNAYYLRRVIGEMFMSIFNGMTRSAAIARFQQELQTRNLTDLMDVDFNTYFNLIKVRYCVEVSGDKANIIFLIQYSLDGKEKKVRLWRTLPVDMYQRLSGQSSFKYVMFYYMMVGFDTGHFWGMHPSIYDRVASDYDDPIECFASPFNHNLPRFFSLFPDIDRPYGSVGNFFDRFLDASHNMYVINPPFVEDIVRATMDATIRKLDNRAIRTECLVFVPQWDDMMLPWIDLLQTRHHVIVSLLEKQRSLVYDYLEGKQFSASFNTYIIYCNNFGVGKQHTEMMEHFIKSSSSE
jgi:hypothetical protein